VLTKEIEKGGIPTAFITALPDTAFAVGARRVVLGRAITNPVGDRSLSREKEKEMRRKIVRAALNALTATHTKKEAIRW
jgi:glycine reductase complex component B subunit gamma